MNSASDPIDIDRFDCSYPSRDMATAMDTWTHCNASVFLIKALVVP